MTTCADRWANVWPEIAKGLPAAFVAAVVAGIAAYIAYRQFRVAQAKLKLDLFERRYSIFEMVWGFTSGLAQGNIPDWGGEKWVAFTNRRPEIAFLFGRDISEYCDEINKKANELKVIDARIKRNGGVLPPECVGANLELQKWFFEQASTGVRQAFGAYLNFEEWK
ncbi:hypothetical protein [Pandoraea terrigena]|uniref:Uncharacterized protein n=1 Tax=Pandoraea terrigena TaxID=2508292 RepID=A0A5E4YC20_9BURK|nr:hypothetical protein [Pandoraea terrigena]VVE46040.1 hypothetical protein PTE31013_04438 [Pandoraea terrigena]